MSEPQLVITHTDGVVTYHQVGELGWRLNSDTREIVIKRVGSRDIIPLDNVRHYSVEYRSDSPTEHGVLLDARDAEQQAGDRR